MDVIEVVLVCIVYSNQCLSRGCFLDLVNELCWIHLDRGCLLDPVGEMCGVGLALEARGLKGHLTPQLLPRLQ